MTKINKRIRFVDAIIWLDNNKPFLVKVSYSLLLLAYLFIVPLWPVINQYLNNDFILGGSIIIGALVVHFGFLVSLIVNIDEKLIAKNEPWFPSHQEALPRIRDELDFAIKEKPCKIVWIGVSMQSAWLALEGIIKKIEESSAEEAEIILLSANPDFLRSIRADEDGLAKATEGQMDYMRRRCELLNQRLLIRKNRITLAQYSYMPNFHGLLINNHILFISTVRWYGQNFELLSVPREPNELLTSNTIRGRYAIELYNSWLEKGLLSAKEQQNLFCYPSSVD